MENGALQIPTPPPPMPSPPILSFTDFEQLCIIDGPHTIYLHGYRFHSDSSLGRLAELVKVRTSSDTAPFRCLSEQLGRYTTIMKVLEGGSVRDRSRGGAGRGRSGPLAASHGKEKGPLRDIRPRAETGRVEFVMAEINSFLERTVNRLHGFNGKLIQAIDDMAESAAENDDWCEGRDIMALPYADLERILALRPVKNPEQFSLNLMSTLPTAEQSETSPNEMFHRRDCSACNQPHSFQNKFGLLVQHLRSAGPDGTKQAFKLLVWAAGQGWDECKNFGRWSCRATPPPPPSIPPSPLPPLIIDMNEVAQNAEPHANIFSEAVLAVVNPESDAPGPFSFDGMTWEQPAYWDFAACRRELWDAYSGSKCETSNGFGNAYIECNEIWSVCVRKRTIGLLEVLQRRAADEIREKVALFISGRLPAELYDLVEETAFLVEGIPRDTSVWKMVEIERVPMPNLMHGWHKLNLGHWSLKTEYRCDSFRIKTGHDEKPSLDGSSESGEDV